MILLWYTIVILSLCECSILHDLSVYGDAKNGYYITVYIGTPPQVMNLLLDTGSSNIAVASVPSVFNPSNYFHYNESTTVKKLNRAVEIHYTAGEWTGFLVKDIITFNEFILQCTIACMLSLNQIFDDGSKFQGLLGLAYPSIALPDASVQTFLESFTKKKYISDIFCLDLCGPLFSSKEQVTKCGKFQIGDISKHYTDEDIVFTPIVKEWYYEVVLTELKIGNNRAPFTCSDLNQQASLIDSGTTELLLPDKVYYWVLKEIKHLVRAYLDDKLWINETIACVSKNNFKIKDFPSITLSLYNTANTTFDLVISPELYLISLGTKSNHQCFQLAFARSSRGVLIGSTILKGFYVVFDRQNKQIGFSNTSYWNDIPGYVIKPKYAVYDIQYCKMDKLDSPDIWASPFMILVLFSSIMLAIILLYMLVKWIFKDIFRCSNDSSETNSLVENEF